MELTQMPSAHDLAKQLDLTYETGKTALANLERLGVIASRVVEMQTYNQELQESLGNVLTLARLKWGNLDADANKVFEQAETLLAHAAFRASQDELVRSLDDFEQHTKPLAAAAADAFFGRAL